MEARPEPRRGALPFTPATQRFRPPRVWDQRLPISDTAARTGCPQTRWLVGGGGGFAETLLRPARVLGSRRGGWRGAQLPLSLWALTACDIGNRSSCQCGAARSALSPSPRRLSPGRWEVAAREPASEDEPQRRRGGRARPATLRPRSTRPAQGMSFASAVTVCPGASWPPGAIPAPR